MSKCYSRVTANGPERPLGRRLSCQWSTFWCRALFKRDPALESRPPTTAVTDSQGRRMGAQIPYAPAISKNKYSIGRYSTEAFKSSLA